jgi:mannose-6-phosphate isomerase-like protein (cupin superfamily)
LFEYEYRTIENPLIGDRVTFLETAVETGGAYELVQVVLQANGGTPLHYHTAFSEEFEAFEGELYIDCDGRTIVLQPGNKITTPIRSVHRFYNPGVQPVIFRTTIKPARRFEHFLRVSYGLARDGKIAGNGLPRNIWHSAVIFHLGETYMPKVPLPLQKGIFGLLYWIARGFGVERKLTKTYVDG